MSRTVPVSHRPRRETECAPAPRCPASCPTGPTGAGGPTGPTGSAGPTGGAGPTGALGPLEPPDGGLLFNDGGAPGTSAWIYDEASGTLLAPADASQLVAGVAGGPYTVWARGGTGGFQDPEFLVVGGDAAGTSGASTKEAFYEGRDAASLELFDGAASLGIFRGGAFPDFPDQFLETGGRSFPNFAVNGTSELSDRPFADGVGVLALRVADVEPNSGAPAASENQLWLTQTSKLMMQTMGAGDQQLIGSIFIEFAFPSDADLALSVDFSRANIYVIDNGTITVPRKITSTLEPSVARFIIVRNNNDQDVNWAWATGFSATIPAHSTRLVTGTGANAFAIPLA